MRSCVQGLVRALAFLALWFLPSVALAWVETAVRGHEVRVEVSPSGSATIRHELLLKVRGGPMKVLEVDGIGVDVEPLPDAMLRRGTEGNQGAWPLNVSTTESGGLRLGITAERGIRGGSYLFQFGYSMDLAASGRVTSQGSGTEITFVGPRLSSGVDTAKVTFSVPRGSVAPRVVEAEPGAAQVIMGEVRRGQERDEIDLVRAHLATGEPAVWQILVAPGVITRASHASQEHGTAPVGVGRVSPELGPTGVLTTRTSLFIAGALGLFFSLLVFLKNRFLVRASKRHDSRVKPLLPGHPLFRAGLSGVGLSLSAHFALVQEPWLATGTLVPVILASTHLLPVRIVRPRGPGTWERAEGAATRSMAVGLERLFETRSLPGFGFFLGLAGVILFSAYRRLPTSNYEALLIVSLLIPIAPLFWTGRVRDLPEPPLEQAQPWLTFLRRAIDPDVASVELWGRRTKSASEGASDFDEARIRVVLSLPPSGLRAFEVSLDEGAGRSVMPCVVLRVLEDSPTLARLPADIIWQRGRTSEERVALLRPSAPTRAQLLRLVKSLISHLRAPAAGQAPRSVERSAGKFDSTLKATSPSAAPAM